MTSGRTPGVAQKRAVVGPRDHVGVLRRLWPGRNGRYWMSKRPVRSSPNVAFLVDELTERSSAAPAEEFTLAAVVAQTAVDRAAAADRRATTIAGTVAVSASVTFSGGGLLLDRAKWQGADALRLAFGISLCLVVLGFAVAAVFAVRALASKAGRTWAWVTPNDFWFVVGEADEAARDRLRAARLLNDFATNWEIADFKNRNVDNGVRALTLALGLLAVSIVLCLVAA